MSSASRFDRVCSRPSSTVLAGVALLVLSSSCADSPEDGCGFEYPALVHHGKGLKVHYTAGESGLSLLIFEADFVTGEEHTSTLSEPASFEIDTVLHRHGFEFYVLGRAASGEYVGERLSFTPSRGSYTSSRPTALSPIGVAAPLGVTSTFLVDGPFLPPKQRARPSTERSEIFRWAGHPGVRCGAVDPEGRFLLLLTNDSMLVQVSLGGTGAVTTLATASSTPFLAVADSLDAFDHDTEGRKYVLEHDYASEDGRHLVLHDRDNDALFETTELLNASTWATRAYDQHWTCDFILHPW